MAISYEINLICSNCGNKCFTSEPMPKPSVKTACHEAEQEGWEIKRVAGKRLLIYCPSCVLQRQPPNSGPGNPTAAASIFQNQTERKNAN